MTLLAFAASCSPAVLQWSLSAVRGFLGEGSPGRRTAGRLAATALGFLVWCWLCFFAGRWIAYTQVG
jgi:hypothetical protein